MKKCFMFTYKEEYDRETNSYEICGDGFTIELANKDNPYLYDINTISGIGNFDPKDKTPDEIIALIDKWYLKYGIYDYDHEHDLVSLHSEEELFEELMEDLREYVINHREAAA